MKKKILLTTISSLVVFVAVFFISNKYTELNLDNSHLIGQALQDPSTGIEAPFAVFQGRFDFQKKTGCGSISNVLYLQDCNGAIETIVSFPATATYRFDISAQSVNVNGIWAKMEIDIDGVAIGQVDVSSTAPKLFSVSGSVSAGQHTVALALVNDSPESNQKLYIGLLYITQSNASSPYVFPALSQKTLSPGAMLTANDFASGYLRGFNLDSNQSLTKQSMVDMRATGANVARYFLNAQLVPGTNTYEIVPGSLDAADRYIAQGKISGYYVIPVLQPVPGGINQTFWNSPEQEASIIALWQMLAKHWKGNATVAGYDLINEPGTYNYPQWIAFSTQLVQSIRAIDTDHVIIVPNSFSFNYFALTEPLPFTNIVYEAHSYNPAAFTFQGIETTTTTSYPSASFTKADLSATLDYIRSFSRQYNVPIYIGEFSAVRWAPDNSADRYIDDSASLFDAEHWAWTYHAWRGYQGFDAEFPTTEWYKYSYAKGIPQFNFSLLSPSRTKDADGILILKKYFALNGNPVTPPKITVTGGDSTLTVGDTYTDQGATAIDGAGGDISSSITVNNTVDISKAGTYTITYTAKDDAGTSVSATRTVIVNTAQQAAPTTNTSSGGGTPATTTVTNTSPVVSTPTQVFTPLPPVSVPVPPATNLVVPTVASGFWSFLPFISSTPKPAPIITPAAPAIHTNIKTGKKSYDVVSAEYSLNGTVVHTATTYPDDWSLDTGTLADGTYTLTSTYHYSDGTTDGSTSTFSVDNSPTILERIVTYIQNLLKK